MGHSTQCSMGMQLQGKPASCALRRTRSVPVELWQFKASPDSEQYGTGEIPHDRTDGGMGLHGAHLAYIRHIVVGQ